MGRKVKTLPTGITDRKGNLQVAFTLNGRECRQALDIATNKENIVYAKRLRDEVLLAIHKGEFSWAQYFPNSKQIVTTKPLTPLSIHKYNKSKTTTV